MKGIRPNDASVVECNHCSIKYIDPWVAIWETKKGLLELHRTIPSDD